jgi:hypothetical protein
MTSFESAARAIVDPETNQTVISPVSIVLIIVDTTMCD